MIKEEELKNTYVISDIHGCYYTLLNLINKLPNDAKLIFVGDLCDRGLYSKEVIEYIKNSNHLCILGNHDKYFVDHIKECLDGVQLRWNTKKYMGGQATINSYKNDLETINSHIKWLNTLPQYILIKNYFITHAFCMPYFKRRNEEDKSHAMMVNRTSDKEEWEWDWEENWEDYKYINIYGHESDDEIVRNKNYICIDTACVYGGKLTALNLASLETIQEPLDKRDTTLLES